MNEFEIMEEAKKIKEDTLKMLDFHSQKKYKEAFEILLELSYLGLGLISFFLGEYYRHGYYVKIDHKKALGWYEKAANENDKNGLYALGISYYLGLGVEQNYEYAYEYFEEASIFDSVQSFYMLGICSLNGYGTKKSMLEALNWFSLGKKYGNKDCSDMYEKLYLIYVGKK